jgi:hypothetical protein
LSGNLANEAAMTVPVLIQPSDGQYAASLVGSPDLRCVRPSKDAALAALQERLAEKIESGELVNLELSAGSVSTLAGRFADDPVLQDICDEIYRQRDADQT